MFLTRLPVPAGTDHHPTYLMRSTTVRPAAKPCTCAARAAVLGFGSGPLRGGGAAAAALQQPALHPGSRPCHMLIHSLAHAIPAFPQQYFPLIGIAVGLWGAAFYNAAVALWPQPVAAGACVLSTVWLTGGAGDGALLGPGSLERISCRHARRSNSPTHPALQACDTCREHGVPMAARTASPQ
jgi:hypothetical protein